MSGVLSVMVGGGSRSVDVVGGTVSDSVLTPTDASATYFLNASGTETSTPSAISNTWLLSGAASDYEVRATVTSGAVTSGSATGSWLNLGTSRAWSATRAANGAGTASAALTIEVRNATSLAVLDAASVTLSAEVTL